MTIELGFDLVLNPARDGPEGTQRQSSHVIEL
jgi:hypothetical protein